MRNLISIIFITLVTSKSFSQTNFLQTPCAAAHVGTASDMVVEYTIGEMVLVNEWQQNGLYITQGVLQPQIFKLNFNFNVFVDGEIKVFPSPTKDVIKLQMSLQKPGDMTVQIVDALGQVVQTDQIQVTSFQTQTYNLSRNAAGMYIIRLRFKSNDGSFNKIGSFKIVKI